MKKLWVLATLLCCFWALGGSAAPAIPSLTQPVMDEAQALAPATRSYLNSELKRLWDSGGSQIAVLTVPSLDGEPIEAYSIKVTDAWKLGTAKKDNGVLLLIAVQDHKLRIEVGQGNEGVLTDVQSSRIIRQVIAPLFKSGDMDNGVIAGVANIVSLTDPQFSFSQEAPAQPRHLRHPATGAGPLGFLVPFLPIGFFLLIFLLIVLGGGGRGGRGGWGGGGWGGGGWSSGGGGWSSGGGGGGFSGGGGGFSGGGSSGSW